MTEAQNGLQLTRRLFEKRVVAVNDAKLTFSVQFRGFILFAAGEVDLADEMGVRGLEAFNI